MLWRVELRNQRTPYLIFTSKVTLKTLLSYNGLNQPCIFFPNLLLNFGSPSDLRSSQSIQSFILFNHFDEHMTSLDYIYRSPTSRGTLVDPGTPVERRETDVHVVESGNPLSFISTKILRRPTPHLTIVEVTIKLKWQVFNKKYTRT